MLNQISFLSPVIENQINCFEAARDQYYNYLMKKYNCYDSFDLINMITEEENEIREQLELSAMKI